MMSDLENAEHKQDYGKFIQTMTKIMDYVTGVKDVEGAQDKTKDGKYKVKSGDILSEIAKKFNTSIDKLIKYNPELKENPDHIETGQKINLE